MLLHTVEVHFKITHFQRPEEQTEMLKFHFTDVVNSFFFCSMEESHMCYIC